MNKIHIGFSFWLFNAFLFMFCDGHIILSFYSICLIHEFAHIAALHLAGGELYRVELSFWGIRMIAAPAKRIGKGIFVLLSGPAANLILYVILKAVRSDSRLADMSLAAGIFNLLPFSFLDGGAVLDMFFSGRECERKIRFGLAVLRAAVMIILALFIVSEIDIIEYV